MTTSATVGLVTKLSEVEETYGFVFGTPDGYENARTRVAKHVKCTNPQCERSKNKSDAVPVHEDTVHPVLCGGCGAVLLCDHVAGEPDEQVVGTITSPVLRVETRCTRCHTQLDANEHPLAPVALEDLPASTLHALGVRFTRDTSGEK